MPKIHLLNQELINKIAAGEVVERPASALKELIENSIDAGATGITIELENGGIDLIRIIDNGQGMNPEDAKMALHRHATSKISTLADLQALHTLGFRGEALAAISAVSDFRLVTREAQAIGAVEVTARGGEVVAKASAGGQGTLIEVRGLFSPVPARKKFLKSAQTEYRQCLDVILHQALLHPNISWDASQNNKRVVQFPVVQNWKERVATVLHPIAMDDLLPLSHQRASLKLSGFLVHPAKASPRSKDQYLFVNGRAVNDYSITRAIRDAYSHHLAPGMQPAFVVHIEIDPDLVDVNVHPRKSEVKFADPSSIFREVLFATKEALQHFAMKPSEATFQNPLSPVSSLPVSSDTPNLKSFTQTLFSSSQSLSQSQSFSPDTSVHPDRLEVSTSPWKLLGQVLRSYIIAETNDGIVIVDQHAVAEKVLYEKLLANAQSPAIQPLLIPLVFEVSLDQDALLEQQKEALTSLGIELEEFGKQTYRLTGLPQDMPLKDAKHFFEELVTDLEQESWQSLKSLEERQQAVAKMASCRGAIKFGDLLTSEEQLQLIRDIQTYSIVACCHGRPAVIHLTDQQLRKQFHRP